MRLNKKKVKVSVLIVSLLLISFIGLASKGYSTTDIDYSFENDNLYNSTAPTYDDDFNVREYTIGGTYYTGNYFDTSGEAPNPYGITWDGTHFWVCELSIAEVFQYTSAGVYTSVHFDTDSEAKFPAGITWDGTHLWILNSLMSEEVYQYTSAGVYTSVHFDTSSETTSATGITWDGTHFWVVCGVNNEVYQYTSAGVYTSVHFDTSSETTVPSDITYTGFHFLISDSLDSTVYRYTLGGVHDGYSFNAYSEDNQMEGMVFNGSSVWMVGVQHQRAYEYEYLESTTIVEVDRYEFAYEGFQDQYDIGSDIFSNWTEIDDGDDKVNIASDPLFMNDRRIHMEHYAPATQDLGVEKEFYIDYGNLNITWAVNFTTINGLNEFCMKVYSSDDTLVSDVYFEATQLKNGASILYTGITTNEYYELNTYLNYEKGETIIRFYIDGVYEDTYNVSLNSAKDGLGKLENYIDMSVASDMILYLDYIGVYVNGSSITEEFGYVQMEDILGYGEAYWKFREYNLFTFNAIGNLSFWVSDTFYAPFISTVAQINPLNVYSGSNTFNVWEMDDFGGSYQVHEPMLWIQFYDNLNVSEISIDGVKLTETGHEYFLDYTHSNVDIDESYFYVSGGHLYYSITYNDTNLEYIQASFDILDRLGENRSARYYSDTNGNYAEMRLKYTDTTVTGLPLQIHYYISNIILSQEKELDYIQVLITDDDKMSAGTTTGRVSGITLQYLPNIAVTITTLDLLGMIVILIIIIIPTLVIARKLGSKTIIPMLFLMCLLCVATELIPIWLFVVITISLGSFYIVNSKIKGGM